MNSLLESEKSKDSEISEYEDIQGTIKKHKNNKRIIGNKNEREEKRKKLLDIRIPP